MGGNGINRVNPAHFYMRRIEIHNTDSSRLETTAIVTVFIAFYKYAYLLFRKEITDDDNDDDDGDGGGGGGGNSRNNKQNSRVSKVVSSEDAVLRKLTMTTRMTYDVSGSSPSSSKTSALSSTLLLDLLTLSSGRRVTVRSNVLPAELCVYTIFVLLITWLLPGCHDTVTLVC